MNQATLANVARSWKSAATVALEGVGILGNMAEDALALLFPDAAGNAGESERRARLTRVSTMVAEVERRIADAEQALGVATAAFEKKKAVYQRSADNAAKMAADSSVTGLPVLSEADKAKYLADATRLKQMMDEKSLELAGLNDAKKVLDAALAESVDALRDYKSEVDTLQHKTRMAELATETAKMRASAAGILGSQSSDAGLGALRRRAEKAQGAARAMEIQADAMKGPALSDAAQALEAEVAGTSGSTDDRLKAVFS